MANRNANKGNAIENQTIVPQTETILNQTIATDANKNETMQENETIATDAIKTDATDDKTENVVPRDETTIVAEIKNAKRELFRLNEENDYDSANESIVKQELIVSGLTDELKTLKKTIEKNRLRDEYNAKYAIAFNDLKDKLSIGDEDLNTLIANAKDDTKKDTLKSSFEIVFGRVPTFIAENVKGTSLSKSSANSDGKLNLAKMIKDMIEKGNTQDEIVSAIQENSDLDLTKSKKRYTDTKWQYEQSLKK